MAKYNSIPPHLPKELRDLYTAYTATEVIEMFEFLELFMANEGVRGKLTDQFGARYDFTVFLLKRVIRALEPPITPPVNDN